MLDNLSLRKKGAAVVVIPLTILLVAVMLFMRYEREAVRATDRAKRALEFNVQLYKVMALLNGAETAARGYRLTGEEPFKGPFLEAKAEFPGAIAELKRNANYPSLSSSVLQLEQMGREKIAIQDQIIAYPRADITEQPPLELYQASKRSMDAVRVHAQKILDAQEDRLAQRSAETSKLHDQINRLLVVVVLLGMLGAVAAATIFATGISRRVDQLQLIARSITGGERTVVAPGGKDEVGQLGRMLEEMAVVLAARQDDLVDARQRAENLNQELDRQLMAATSANKELEAFSYSVSHDLRAPLRHVAGFSELMLKNAGSLDEKNQRYLNIIVTSIKQMGTLIDDLLEFSRMGRAAIRREPVDLNQVVAVLREEMTTDTADRNIAWKVAALPIVHGDPAMLRLVMQNLLSNAVKYTRGKDPAEISVEPVGSESGPEVGILVRDNGAGFDMQYINKLFGVFQRLHRAEEFEGTGIGLATARRIITRHGGTITANAEPGIGAEFKFVLPTSWKEESLPG